MYRKLAVTRVLQKRLHRLAMMALPKVQMWSGIKLASQSVSQVFTTLQCRFNLTIDKVIGLTHTFFLCCLLCGYNMCHNYDPVKHDGAMPSAQAMAVAHWHRLILANLSAAAFAGQDCSCRALQLPDDAMQAMAGTSHTVE